MSQRLLFSLFVALFFFSACGPSYYQQGSSSAVIDSQLADDDDTPPPRAIPTVIQRFDAITGRTQFMTPRLIFYDHRFLDGTAMECGAIFFCQGQSECRPDNVTISFTYLGPRYVFKEERHLYILADGKRFSWKAWDRDKSRSDRRHIIDKLHFSMTADEFALIANSASCRGRVGNEDFTFSANHMTAMKKLAQIYLNQSGASAERAPINHAQ